MSCLHSASILHSGGTCAYSDSSLGERVGWEGFPGPISGVGSKGGLASFYFYFYFYIFITHMQPQREGYDEPEPTGLPGSARLCTTSGGQLIGFPGWSKAKADVNNKITEGGWVTKSPEGGAPNRTWGRAIQWVGYEEPVDSNKNSSSAWTW